MRTKLDIYVLQDKDNDAIFLIAKAVVSRAVLHDVICVSQLMHY
jgi:hypothetical protein